MLTVRRYVEGQLTERKNLQRRTLVRQQQGRTDRFTSMTDWLLRVSLRQTQTQGLHHE